MGLGITELMIAAPLAYVAAFVIHEAGHYIAGLAIGCKVRISTFKQEIWGMRIPHPLIVAEGDMTKTQTKIFAVAGFALEFIALSAFAVVAAICGGEIAKLAALQTCICAIHLIAYPFYNSGSQYNDFNRWC